jgi:hypothetical protein
MEYNRLQFHLEATAGTQRLWKSWGRMTGTQWAMTDTEAPGKVRTSPDRFNLKRMKARAYKLPEGTPDRWTKFDESQWLAESGVVRGHMKENPVMAKIDVLIEQAEKAPYKSLVRRTMGREVPPRDKSVDTWRSEFIAFIRRNRWPDGREVPSGYASLGRLDYSGEREPNNMYYDSRSAFMETWEQFMLTRPWEKEAKNPMKCEGCGKAISGAYEGGSYSCSGCGADVQVNPSPAPFASGLLKGRGSSGRRISTEHGANSAEDAWKHHRKTIDRQIALIKKQIKKMETGGYRWDAVGSLSEVTEKLDDAIEKLGSQGWEDAQQAKWRAEEKALHKQIDWDMDNEEEMSRNYQLPNTWMP